VGSTCRFLFSSAETELPGGKRPEKREKTKKHIKNQKKCAFWHIFFKKHIAISKSIVYN